VESFTETSVLTTSLMLEWTVEDQVEQDHFTIEYQGQGSTTWTLVSPGAITGTSKEVTELRAGEKYSFRIRAVSGGQTSDHVTISNIVMSKYSFWL
jgi:hypothetical protein